MQREGYQPSTVWGKGSVSSTCSRGLLDRSMAGGSTLSVTRALCRGWRCSKVVQKVKLRAAMSRSVSFTNGYTSSTADFIVTGWMLLQCPATSTYAPRQGNASAQLQQQYSKVCAVSAPRHQLRTIFELQLHSELAATVKFGYL